MKSSPKAGRPQKKTGAGLVGKFVVGDPQYRVFLSYSHGDDRLVTEIEEAIRANKLLPIRAQKQMTVGKAFDDQIRLLISHAHVFVPVITPKADERRWVHEEIGYAIARNVPVLAVVVNHDIKGMLERLQALVVKRQEVVRRVREVITRGKIMSMIEDTEVENTPWEVVDHQSARARMIAKYAGQVRTHFGCGRVRQQAALSTFAIPNCAIEQAEWLRRYGTTKVETEEWDANRLERIELEKHAESAGARLILNPHPALPFISKDCGDEAIRQRMKTLLAFLKSEQGLKTRVAMSTDNFLTHNITMVGDGFVCESVSPDGRGFRQTTFTRHAPTVFQRAQAFDEKFDRLVEKAGGEKAAHDQALIELAKLAK